MEGPKSLFPLLAGTLGRLMQPLRPRMNAGQGGMLEVVRRFAVILLQQLVEHRLEPSAVCALKVAELHQPQRCLRRPPNVNLREVDAPQVIAREDVLQAKLREVGQGIGLEQTAPHEVRAVRRGIHQGGIAEAIRALREALARASEGLGATLETSHRHDEAVRSAGALSYDLATTRRELEATVGVMGRALDKLRLANRLREADELRGEDVVPGFSCRLGELFPPPLAPPAQPGADGG